MILKTHRRFLFSVLLTALHLQAAAQNFEWEAKISKPDSSGYYHILLEPKISSKLNAQLSDIRIYDEKNLAVPYLIDEERALVIKSTFRPYTILERESKKKCCSSIIFHNPERSRITNFSLFVRNADVSKFMRISGSDDRKEWYGIWEGKNSSSISSDSGTTEYRIYDFPLSDYEYFLIEMDDSTSSRVQVISVGYNTTYSEIGNYTALPLPHLVQGDSLSQKRSYVKVAFDGEYNIDRIVFSIDGPRHYLRNARLVQMDKNGKIPAHGGTEFQLNSRTANQFDIGVKKLGEFYIVIENEDNPPLKIKSVTGFQLTRYLAAYLEKDQQYVLRFGNKDVGFPSYDMGYFRENVPLPIPLAATMGMHKLTVDEAKVPEKSSTDSTLIWIAIAAVVGLLGYMSVKMVREMKS